VRSGGVREGPYHVKSFIQPLSGEVVIMCHNIIVLVIASVSIY
jgi:hypothetical protein